MDQFFDKIFQWDTLYMVLAYLITVTLHELAHGLVAYKLGDPTAKQSGRLSLNPLRHIDPIGLLMLIFFRFGWAKPVQVDMRYFKKPHRDFALTGLAGPVMNFLLALFFALLLKLGFALQIPSGVFYDLLMCLIMVSVSLGIFNLLPIPPLDGSKVMGLVLPDRIYYRILPYERYGMIVLILLLQWQPFLNALMFVDFHVLRFLDERIILWMLGMPIA